MKKTLPYLELAARIYACLMLSTYGLGKIMGGQFYQGPLPEQVADLPLSEVGGFDLAWTFFGYSFGYILFIGGTQLLGAILLLFNKTKVIGALILVPILMNIIVVDFFYGISTGAMLSAISYFIAVNFVLFYNREAVFEAIKSVWISDPETDQVWRAKAFRLVIACIIVACIVLLENQMLNLVGR